MNELPDDRQQKPDSNGTPNSEPLIRRHTTPDMAATAAYGMVLCGTDELEHRYRGRIEKVKFGVPITEAFSHDIPATLLVLLLKVNKEGPLKKDIWRAPGNQAQVRKLSNIMQHGRLVNISNISVYTAASVIKRFLAKLPGGILGADNEKQLFEAVERNMGEEASRELFCRIVSGLPVPSQHLLVLLFGTFRVITDSADSFGTRMTPEAIGISVAPSLFHTCIHDGQRAKLEDVMRFKLASKVISDIIRGFGFTNLFPRECYEFYARITGRTLRVDEQWHFSFQLPSNPKATQSAEQVNAVSRRGSRRSRRKSSTSSSAASILSQLQSVRALASQQNKTTSTDLASSIPAIYRSVSQRTAIIKRAESIHTSTIPPNSFVDKLGLASGGCSNELNNSTPPTTKQQRSSHEDREKRSSFFLLSPSVTSTTAMATTNSGFSNSHGGSGWHLPGGHGQHQVATSRRNISATRSGPPLPPPPTNALQRRIDAYCVAANLNPKIELQRGRPAHKDTNGQQQQPSQFPI